MTLAIVSGVEPWTFEQHRGEAIFIPAGCPFQITNLQVNLFRCNIIPLSFFSLELN